LTSRTAAAIRAQGSWIRPFAGTTDIPYYRRFFLGGENQIRGVDIRSVGPMDADQRNLGGDKYVLFNAEYYVDLFSQVRLVGFHDAGQAYLAADPLDLRQLRTSTGVELRIVMPIMNVPLRFIYAWNLYRDSFQPARAFKFAMGTAF